MLIQTIVVTLSSIRMVLFTIQMRNFHLKRIFFFKLLNKLKIKNKSNQNMEIIFRIKRNHLLLGENKLQIKTKTAPNKRLRI